MIERVEVALGGFAVDLFETGHAVARRLPLKKFRAPADLIGEPLRIASATPLGDKVRLIFSDGEVREPDPLVRAAIRCTKEGAVTRTTFRQQASRLFLPARCPASTRRTAMLDCTPIKACRLRHAAL